MRFLSRLCEPPRCRALINISPILRCPVDVRGPPEYLQKRLLSSENKSAPSKATNHEGLVSEQEQESQDVQPPPGLRTHLATLLTSTIRPVEGDFWWKNRAKCVSSFSAEKDLKTIYVPGAPPKWNVKDSDIPLRYYKKSDFTNLDLSDIRNDVYFAVLRHLRPAYDYSRVHIDCDWDVLARLQVLFVGESLNKRGLYKRLYPKSVDVFSFHMVSNTLFIRKVCEPEAPSEEKSTEYPKRDFQLAATTPHPDIPVGATTVYNVEYNVGPLKCVVHMTPDAWLPTEEDRIESQPLRNIDGHSVGKPKGNFKSGFEIREAGAHIPLSSLLLVKALQSPNMQASWPQQKIKERKEAKRSKQLRHRLHKLARRSWPQVFFSRIPTTYRAFLSNESMICHAIRQHDSLERALTEEDDNSLRRMCSLLTHLMDITASSKEKACVACVARIETPSAVEGEFKVDVWEPEFDEEILKAREVPEHQRIPRQVVSDKDYRQFWLANRNASS